MERLAKSRGRSRAAERGFSLIEMLAALAVIGIMAAYATPAFVDVMRDQRVNQGAMKSANLYRTARTRAMDRGSAVLVRWNGGAKTITVLEAVLSTTLIAGTPNVLPVASCLTTVWDQPSATSQVLTVFSPESIYHDLATAQMLWIDGNPTNDVDVCFTPRGRTFVRNDTAAPLVPMNGVPRLRLTNTLTGAVRAVLIPPSGGARLVL